MKVAGRPAFERRTIFAKSRASDSQSSNHPFLGAGPEQHQGSAGAKDDAGGSYGCVAARSALILPFTWEDDTVSAVNWTEKLLRRCIRDKQTGRRVPLWELNQSLPLETAELSAHFRQIVGWNEEVRRTVHVEARRRLDLPEASPAAAAPTLPSGGEGQQQHQQQSKGMEEEDGAGKGMEDEEGEGEEDDLDGGEGGELEESSGDEDEAEDEAAHRRKMEVWKCSRLRLTASALASVFPEPALWAADMQGQSNTVAFDNSSHLAFLTSTTNLLQSQPQPPQPHGLHPRQPGGLATPGPSDAAATAAAAAGSALRVPRSRSTPYIGRPELQQTSAASRDGGGAADAEDDKEVEEEKDDSDDDNDAVVETPSKRKPVKSRMPLRRSESQRPVTPIIRVPPLMSTMPDSPFTPSGPSTVSALDAKTTSLRIGVPCVELVLYPMGGGLLVFHIDWMPNARNKKLSVDELRRWLFLVKFRHRVKKVFLGWTLGPSDHAKLLTPRSKKNERNSAPILGKLAGSIKGEELISLATIGNWLLHLPNESEQLPPHRVSHGTHANHHSTVVLDREPAEDDLQEYLFHLTRAFGQRNRPPPVKKAGSRLDQMLVHRQNRYIGISREGSVALSWPTDDSNVQFERVTWPKLFQGVYLILALHARGEAVVLSELSNLSASAAEHLRLDCTDNIEYLERHRAELRYLAMLMIKYSLGMSSDDCGGLPEYSNFFSTMRKMLGIPEARQEIRGEIQDVLGIVESGYMEEQRRQAASEKRTAKLREFTQQVAETRRDEKTKRIERLISVIGAVTIPIVVVSGLPIEVVAPPAVSFWHLLVGVVLLSMLFAGALLYWQYAPSHDVDLLPVPGIGLESDDQKAAQLRGDNMKASGVWDTVGPGVTPHRPRSGPDPSVLLTGLRSVRRGVSNDELQSVLRSHKPRKHVSYGAVDLEAPMTPFAPPACGRPPG